MAAFLVQSPWIVVNPNGGRPNEDASLSYTGINLHEGENIGLYDTVPSDSDMEMIVCEESSQ